MWIFEHIAHLIEPIFCFFFFWSVFVEPMCCLPFFCHLIHALGADLHLHPLVIAGFYGGVERLITRGLGCGDPVAKPFWIGGINIRHDGIGTPAIFFFPFWRAFNDDPDCKKIINLFKFNVLVLHLCPDAGNGFRAPFDGAFEAMRHQITFDGGDE